MLTIRPEKASDIEAVHEVEALAFARANEARLVDSLRASGKATLSLVAEDGGRIVGHILFSPMAVEPAVIEAVALGPLAVRPDEQRKGIGGRLIKAGIAECRRRGWDAIFLLGHPQYYPRFGFQCAAGMRVSAEPGVNLAHFFYMEMWEGAVGSTPLMLRFAPEFWQQA